MALRARTMEDLLGPLERPRGGEFLVLTALCAASILGTYTGLDRRDAELLARGHRFFAPATFLDAYIPLWPWMVWVYLSYFVCFFVIMAVTLRDRRVMYEGTVAYVGCALGATAIFAALPSRMDQPSLVGCQGVDCAVLGWFYRVDNGFHIFPSLHVAYPTVVWLFLARYLPRARAPVGLWVLAIWASTVLLRRHYLWDIPAGALLAVGAYALGRRVGGPVARALQRGKGA
ncbi:MAG: phosphatase PAP2 family protein [Deltaproteobacteria bacterium]|nr:phosphatase PAP2 family protein [Deltaproteobacteria bacterium]